MNESIRKMKKRLCILTMAVLLICCISNNALAETVDKNAVKMPIIGLSNLENTRLEVSEKIIEQIKQEVPVTRASTGLKIGTNYTSTSADYASTSQQIDFGSSTISRKAGTDSNGWADCKVALSQQYGNGKAWAFFQDSFTIQANGSQTARNCQITFKSDGNVDGYLYHSTDAYCGSQVAVWAEVYDLTDDNLVDQFTGWYKQNEDGGFSKALNISGTVNLKAGHNYSFLMVLYTEAYNYVPTYYAWADSYSGKCDGYGLDYGSVKLTWQ